MKINKTILLGLLFILLAGVIFITDFLTPIIRPVTYLFLMGSSKGKDIMFFGLLGLFLIISQIINHKVDTRKYLKISIAVGGVLLVLGILIEVLFRFQMGIALNTIFASMTNGMSSTSILHTHLIKSIMGEVITNLMGPFIQSDINTGVGLYSYVPNIAKPVILLIPIFAACAVLANQKRNFLATFSISFFSSCLIIGAIDGGLFATPAIVGICGLYFVYRNGYYITRIIATLMHDERLLEANEENQPPYRNKGYGKLRLTANSLWAYFAVILIICLRFTIAFAGADTDYYTVNVANPVDDLEIPGIPVEKISQTNNTVTYHVDSSYNEMELLNDLKIPLNNSCEYYTVSWNIYSYL